MKYVYIVLLASFISVAVGQVTVVKDYDLSEGIANGDIGVTIEPSSLTPEIDKLFDGEEFTTVGLNGGDSIVVTLEIPELIEFYQSKVYFTIANGFWGLEIAESLADLNSGSGTYQQIAADKQFNAFSWDSVAVNAGIKAVRLTAYNNDLNLVYLGEWKFQIQKNIVSLFIAPHPPKLLPGTNLELEPKMLDEDGNVLDYELEESLIWSSSNPSVTKFMDDNTVLTGISVGTSEISVKTISNLLTYSINAEVLNSIEPLKADKKIVKVAVIYQNPMVAMGQRLHQRFNWINPKPMVQQLLTEYEQASGGVIEFQIVEEHDDNMIFTMLDSTYLTVNQLVTYFSEPGWVTIKDLAEVQGRIKYDYIGMIEHHDYFNKRQNGEIDEVWVYGHPFTGMWESQLIGQTAFWWNSSPIKDVPAWFTKLLSVMGFNYERTVDLAMHSMGHRMESAIRYAYGRWNMPGNDIQRPYTQYECEHGIHQSDKVINNFKDFTSSTAEINLTTQSDLNNWELFTLYDKILPGKANVGNIHYPPNAQNDYDYGLVSPDVITYGDNWFSYPWLLDQTKVVDCSEWNCSQLGYMRWWFSRIPHFAGVSDGILNNWWHYFIDFDEAEALAAITPVVSVEDELGELNPDKYYLSQNFPNPFNPSTQILFNIPEQSFVNIKVFDILGREVEHLVSDQLGAGIHNYQFNGRSLSSGVYFYSLEAQSLISNNKFRSTRKMILLK